MTSLCTVLLLDSKLLCCLAHRCIMFYNIIRNLDGSLPRYNLSKKSPQTTFFYNVCREIFMLPILFSSSHQLFHFSLSTAFSPYLWYIILCLWDKHHTTSYGSMVEAVKTLASHAGIRGSIPLGGHFQNS